MISPELVKRAIDAIKVRAVNYEYFFDNLTSPDWIKPLWDGGMFRNPPAVIREGDYVRFPIWPESRYLARMASLEPEIVVDVILKIPDTDNVRVHEDFVDASLAMPPDISAKLVSKAKEWAKSPYQLLLPEKLGSFISHLAKGNEVQAALELAQVLLEVLPAAPVETESGERVVPPLAEPRAQFDEWEYEQIIKKNVPELVGVAGMRAFTLLCDLLETTICLSRHGEGDEGPEDYSYVWRPVIENHAQNPRHGIKDILVSAMRDAAEQIAKVDAEQIPKLVQALEARNWHIFHRIALHLLRQFPEVEPDLVASRLTNRSLFDNATLWHEYALLLKERFGVLSPQQQQTILGWIEEGPDVGRFKEFRKQETGKEPADADAERYCKMWQRDQLSPIVLQLPRDWKERYEALVAEYGESEHPEFPVYSEGWVGPTSPKTIEELRVMSVVEIVDFLKTWQPSREFMSPSPEGLGRSLSAVIVQEPERFAKAAERFEGLNPTYVRALLSGLRDAVKNNKFFDWCPVIDLCRWAVEQPRSVQKDRPRYEDADPNWGWTRKEIAHLLSTGLEKGEAEIPYEFREHVWAILQPITDDPEPTPEHEAKYGGSNMDPVTLSINTVRGEAMHAVIRYALWVRRRLETLPDGKDLIERGFDAVPEVREVLNAHLDPDYDPSLAIRAVYGQWFPWLVLLDPKWAKGNLSQIFPRNEMSYPLRDAAWEAYIVFCRPYDNVFEVLRDEYKYAVDRIGTSTRDRKFADPDQHLANHLMTFYWRGKLDLNDEKGVLTQFWAKASDELIGHALEFVGRSLKETKGEVPTEISERLKRLWLERLVASKSSTSAESHTREISSFGWWFGSEKFDDQWAIRQLREALKVAGKVEPVHLVVKRLGRLAKALPSDAVECLKMIVEGDKEGWSVLSYRAEAHEILETALRSGDVKANGAATNLIHYLGSRGYLEFRDLLRQP